MKFIGTKKGTTKPSKFTDDFESRGLVHAFLLPSPPELHWLGIATNDWVI